MIFDIIKNGLYYQAVTNIGEIRWFFHLINGSMSVSIDPKDYYSKAALINSLESMKERHSIDYVDKTLTWRPANKRDSWWCRKPSEIKIHDREISDGVKIGNHYCYKVKGDHITSEPRIINVVNSSKDIQVQK